jgi:hypothetical protein
MLAGLFRGCLKKCDVVNQAVIEALHRTYCEQTKLELQLTLQRIYQWEMFALHFTEPDLYLVCRSLKFQVDQGKRSPTALYFRRLIGDLENFEEYLAHFRALKRKPHYDPGKVKVLKATGRETEPKPAEAKSAGSVLEGLKIAQQLRDFKEKL